MRPSSNLCVALTVASLTTPLCARRTKAAPGVFEALTNAGASQFASLVRDTPDLLDLLVGGEIAHLLAPTDSHSARLLRPRHAGIAHERRASNTSQPVMLQAVAYNQKLEDMQSGTSKRRALKARTAKPSTAAIDYGFVVETAHDANLNDNSGQNLVVQPVDVSPTSDDGPNVIAQVYSGLGRIVNVLEGKFEFARCADRTGSIYRVEDYFTVPENLCNTAEKLNLTTFEGLVKCAGLSELLNNKPSITVFVPSNEAFEDAGVGRPDHRFNKETTAKIKSLVVPNFLGYTPNLEDGQVLTSMNGTKIKIVINEDGIFVNGAKIIQRDVVLDNGVAHVIDKAFPWL
ncbi:FAS1 domain-containing protein [Podospora aff. communis PSN243]|uniref:FAS1 domain-containing protein n=1 Tax=Podospora aff. communis PSN243 TaxID=3040156 RepID=A0AAV9GK92_9PEZI|nr:FAS1 domain-containing protein [Podospora aff. communis PSN243]